MEAQIFRALGDPLRLEIVSRLSDGSSYTLTDITKDLGISRQGARKQVQVLVDARIVSLNNEGREVKVMLVMSTLRSGKNFIEELENQWDKRLGKLKDFVEKNVVKKR